MIRVRGAGKRPPLADRGKAGVVVYVLTEQHRTHCAGQQVGHR